MYLSSKKNNIKIMRDITKSVLKRKNCKKTLWKRIYSLLGYWYVTAQKKGIDFSLDIKIPMKMEFKGADICLILVVVP